MAFASALLVLVLCVIGSGAIVNPLAQSYGQGVSFSSATALKMAQACIAYARARNAAVNIFIYNERGELVHFQRMDGAPPLGPSFNSGRQYGGDPFINGPGPVVAIPDTSADGGVPVVVNGTTVGSARAAGMGDAGDLACAQAAAEAAKLP